MADSVLASLPSSSSAQPAQAPVSKVSTVESGLPLAPTSLASAVNVETGSKLEDDAEVDLDYRDGAVSLIKCA